MGLVGYYRRFIEGLSKLAYPIMSLQRKETKFNWTKKCENSFQKLKHLFTIVLILRITDPSIDVVVCTNAYKEGIGGILL